MWFSENFGLEMAARLYMCACSAENRIKVTDKVIEYTSGQESIILTTSVGLVIILVSFFYLLEKFRH